MRTLFLISLLLAWINCTPQGYIDERNFDNYKTGKSLVLYFTTDPALGFQKDPVVQGSFQEGDETIRSSSTVKPDAFLCDYLRAPYLGLSCGPMYMNTPLKREEANFVPGSIYRSKDFLDPSIFDPNDPDNPANGQIYLWAGIPAKVFLRKLKGAQLQVLQIDF